MSYTYLIDGTDFNAAEINTRLDSVANELNNVDSDALSWGALRHEHLPMLIGPSGYPEGNFTRFTAIKGGAFNPSDTVAITYGSNELTVGGTTLPTQIVYGVPLDMTDRNVSAFIVLFNANIRKFMLRGNTDSGVGLGASIGDINAEDRLEDFLGAKFTIMVEFSGGGSPIPISHGSRSISPGYAMAGIEVASGATSAKQYNTPGQALRPDFGTNKDVALRTVILPEDLGSRRDRVERIYVKCEAEALAQGGTGISDHLCVEVSKMNLTVIPIQAEVRQ